MSQSPAQVTLELLDTEEASCSTCSWKVLRDHFAERTFCAPIHYLPRSFRRSTHSVKFPWPNSFSTKRRVSWPNCFLQSAGFRGPIHSLLVTEFCGPIHSLLSAGFQGPIHSLPSAGFHGLIHSLPGAEAYMKPLHNFCRSPQAFLP